MSVKAKQSLMEELEKLMDELGQQTIELDCPPGDPRPGDLIEAVIEGTGLPLRQPASKFFGLWTWYYQDIKQEDWKKAQPILEKRIKDLYARGIIRYGSW